MPSQADLIQRITSVIRVDLVGADINPLNRSGLARTVMPDGTPVSPELIGKIWYPYCNLVVSPPVLDTIDYTTGYKSVSTRVLIAWSFPNATYAQLPTDSVCNVINVLTGRMIPRAYRVKSGKVGAQQLDGSQTWQLVVELVFSYELDNNDDLSILQPDDYAETIEPITIDIYNVGLWETDKDEDIQQPDIETATLDVRLALER